MIRLAFSFLFFFCASSGLLEEIDMTKKNLAWSFWYD